MLLHVNRELFANSLAITTLLVFLACCAAIKWVKSNNAALRKRVSRVTTVLHQSIVCWLFQQNKNTTKRNKNL